MRPLEENQNYESVKTPLSNAVPCSQKYHDATVA